MISFPGPIDPGLWFAMEVAGALLTLIAAALSYRFLELPILRKKARMHRVAQSG